MLKWLNKYGITVIFILMICIIGLLGIQRDVLKRQQILIDERTAMVDSILNVNTILSNKIKKDSLQINEYKHFLEAISDARYTFYVTVTMYNAEESQTDNSPLITADNTFIIKEKINELKYIAVSRDLHSRYGGPFKFGDKVLLLNAGVKNGVYIIKDLMNRRFKRRIDILEMDFAEQYKFRNAFIIDLKSSKLSNDLNKIIN
jgi:hypothetical protein